MTLKYAPKDLKLTGFDFGFNVVRSYHFVGDEIERKDDVRKDIKSGLYIVKYGELVRIRVQFVAKEMHYHVALVDNVPAGFEVLNPNLKTTIPIPRDNESKFESKWYDHVNYRESRVEVFKECIKAGTYYFTYVCRAKTTGNFICVPCKVEEMYDEEVCGSTNSEFVSIVCD